LAPPAASNAALAQLSLFSDGFQSVLAPSEWTICQGDVGGDGSLYLSVWSPGMREGIVTVTEDHASMGSAVCSLFSIHLPRGYCRYLATKPVKGELVSHPSPTVAVFVDPPGVFGTGDPSGGPETTIGVVAVTNQPTESNTKLTCAIPGPNHGLCLAIISNYFRWETPPTLPAAWQGSSGPLRGE
jgi:hypothetical protein